MSVVAFFAVLFQFILIAGKWLLFFVLGFLLYWWGLGRLYRRRVDTPSPITKQ